MTICEHWECSMCDECACGYTDQCDNTGLCVECCDCDDCEGTP